MSRTCVRRRRRMAAALLCMALALVVSSPVARALGRHGGSVQMGVRPARPSEQVYVVRVGDTVWSIAEGMAGGRDPRVLVDAIAARNHIDAGAVVPGQSVIVPRIA
ncbi:MAG: LysM peptidoglycan-binding domain-containing protein [Actinomycetota bacterium]